MPGTTPSQSGAEATVAPERAVLCPYCGASASGSRCASCGGLFEPLSMQATQNEMGPWFIRDLAHPFRPGCSHGTLRRLADRGRITPETILRGPTTRQFWSFARNVRGVAHLLGECHNCHGPASADEYMCRSCGAVFESPKDRQHFGVGPVRLIPGQAPPEVVARSSIQSGGADAETDTWSRPVTRRTAPASPERPRTAEPSISPSTVRSLKRRLAQSRRIVTLSIAVNIVLIGAIVVTSLSPNLSFRGGAPASDAPAEDTASNAAPAVAPSPQSTPAIATAMTEAQRLAASDDIADWRRAESLLAEALHDTPPSDRPAAATDLLADLRERIDNRTLEQFLPPE